MPAPLKVLCVGVSPELLETRRLVLRSAGYETTCLLIQQALETLASESFDVMILSVSVPEEDRDVLKQAASQLTRVIQLDSFTDPRTLLGLVRASAGA